MININDRITEALDGSDALTLGNAYRNEIKRLIADVLIVLLIDKQELGEIPEGTISAMMSQLGCTGYAMKEMDKYKNGAK